MTIDRRQLLLRSVTLSLLAGVLWMHGPVMAHAGHTNHDASAVATVLPGGNHSEMAMGTCITVLGGGLLLLLLLLGDRWRGVRVLVARDGAGELRARSGTDPPRPRPDLVALCVSRT